MDLDLPSSWGLNKLYFLFSQGAQDIQDVDSSLLIYYGLLLIILIIGSALVSGSEVAFFSLGHNEFAQLENEESRQAKAILKLKEVPRSLLATILIANNFINIAIVLISDLIVEQSLGENAFSSTSKMLNESLGILEISSYQSLLSNAVTILGVTFILVLFGEITPKVYAQVNKMRLAKFMAQPLMIMLRLFKPLASFLVRGSNLIERRLERKTDSSSPSRAEIDQAIELTVVDDTTENSEIDILKRIVSFGDVMVKQIMTARVDVIAIDIEMDFSEVLKIVKDSGYSRIPVFEEDFDKITGILYAKDLLPFLDQPKTFNWQALIRDNMIFAPEAKKINIMLKEFQSSRMHLAVVVDEYGGTLGIVTLEDILEEVIGDIKDEFDDEVELVYQRLDKDNFIFEGKTLLNDIYKILEIESNYFEAIRGEADSIAGLLLEIAKTIPTINTEFRFKSFVFKVISVDKKRIKEVKITRT